MKCHGNHYATSSTPVSRRTNHKTGAKNGRVELELKYEAPQAEKVFVVGDFNQWRAGDTRLTRDATGTWKTKLRLAPGRYEYRFIVDSEWKDDPHATDRVTNDFGSSNCVLQVN